MNIRSAAFFLFFWGISTQIGCLDDLPPPLACPPDAVTEGGSCVEGLQGAVPGCLTLEQASCLTGPRTSCTCIADECPRPDEICAPEGDCPTEVFEVAPEARCVPLTPKDFGAGLPSEFQCLCGCAGCLAVCDGRGPVLGVLNDGSDGYAPVAVDIAAQMPDAGSLGVYLRLRGIATALLGVLKGADPNYELVAYYLVSAPIGTEMESQVHYNDPLLGTSEYTWSQAADKPTLLVILPGEGTPQTPALSLVEIDCVVPFVVPDEASSN